MKQKVADRMINLRQERARGLVDECSSLNQQHYMGHPMMHVLAFCGDLQELFRHLEAAYQEVDTVFAVNGLAHMVNTAVDVHIREGGGGTYTEAFSNKVVQFGLHAATEAKVSNQLSVTFTMVGTGKFVA
ncbi:hypothetical protein PHMEG_00031264 [Phytophthora megakarya]|uniref:Uncharacterized protein n=1 Tax=Phytophthora megakarya TaxID=4795 RepID=A0A225UX48_9STRA|nr:hypothetical protein PHMEG_00031264 [Phytophthora megakarya]